MKWYDYVNASKHGNYLIKINGEYLLGSYGSGLLYFPKSLANASVNWNDGYTKEEWDAFIKSGVSGLAEGTPYDEEDAKAEAERGFGVHIFFSERGRLKKAEERKKQIFSYKNSVYMMNGFRVLKVDLDLTEAQKAGKERESLDHMRGYYLSEDAVSEIKEIDTPADIVQVGEYLYYLQGSRDGKGIKEQFRSYNMETGVDRLLYEGKYESKSTDIATDGENVYFYMPASKTAVNDVHAMKYSIKENRVSRITDNVAPDEKNLFLDDPGNFIYKAEDSLKISIVKRKSSAKAWKVIEKYYCSNAYNWYVDSNAIYFSMKDTKNTDTVVYKRIDLRTGEVSNSMRIEHVNGINTDMYTDMKINTRDNFRFDIHSYAGTQIYQMTNNRPILKYDIWWGFYFDKE